MKRILLPGIFLVLILLGYAALLLASLSYDESNPRDRANSYYIHNRVEINRPVSEVFSFIQYRIPEIYTELTGMHSAFEILNADKLEVGAEIKSIEGDNDEIVRNLYVVTKVVPEKLIQKFRYGQPRGMGSAIPRRTCQL